MQLVHSNLTIYETQLFTEKKKPKYKSLILNYTMTALSRSARRTKLFLTVSVLSMSYSNEAHAVSIFDQRDSVILSECQGHPIDNMIYIMAPQNICMTAEGLMGVWACRETDSIQHSVCLPSVDGFVIGQPGDTCGCCNGKCPTSELCQCPCNGGVYVEERIFWNFKIKKCYSEGLAEALVAQDGDVSCFSGCLK
jgi:hypothetical protein